MTASEGAARLAAAAAIAASVLLAAAWAFIVPIFQAPDEPAHFDYAMSILRAGRLVRVTDGPEVWIATKDVQYLLHATDFDRVAWHSTMREPADYGAREYFRRLDAGAPPVNAAPQPPERINYITASYPYGFYALEAAWMWAIAKLTGSITAMFFAARLLCVAMLGTGLICNYYTALLLGMRRWPAAGFIAAVGLLPLTSFVSSYVQPDNLAYALLSVCILCAAALARGGIRAWPVVGLSLALGALAVTKYQFFIAAALPSYALLAVMLWRARTAATTLWCGAIALASLFVFGAAQHWVGGASKAADWVSQSNGAGILGTLAATPARGVSAFTDCFISGLCAATYWQVVGWFDTPIVVASWGSEMAIRAAISLVSVLAAGTTVFFAFRNARRLAAIAVRGRPAAAAFIALSDPAFNAYVLFLGAMLALYVLSNNAFTAEGRHFYPFAFVALLGLVWYAPRTFGRRQRSVAVVVAILALTYSTVAAGFALSDVSARYYGPTGTMRQTARAPITLGDPAVSGALWPVQNGEYGLGHPSSTFSVGESRRLNVWGIAAFPQHGVAASDVAIAVDNGKPVEASALMYDATVAEGSRNSAYGFSEFWAPLHGAFPEGAHLVRAYARDPKARVDASLKPARPFFITAAPGGRFSTAFRRRVTGAPRVAGNVQFLGVCKGAWIRGKPPMLPNTAVALFAVTLKSKANSNAIVWLEVQGSPYPTRATGVRTAVGTIPLRWLGIGRHEVNAVETNASTGLQQMIARSASILVVAPNNTIAANRGGNSKNCSDPLLQMQAWPQ